LNWIGSNSFPAIPIIVVMEITTTQMAPNTKIITLKPLAELLEYACMYGWGKQTDPRHIAAANPNIIG